MSRVRADRYTDRAGTGSPTFSEGVNVVGISSLGITTVTGVGQTALTVNGDARITGVLTVGQGSVTIDGTSGSSSITGVTTAGITSAYLNSINNLNYPTAGPLSNRNIVVNGAMQVAQRGNTVSSINSGIGYYTADRFRLDVSMGTWTSDRMTNSQGDTYESGSTERFRNSLRLTCTAGQASPGATDNVKVVYFIEGQDAQHLDYGTTNAKTMTLSFWVRSTKTGTGTLELIQEDNSDRQYSASYTINATNTWEYKTITIPGDTSGLINNDSGRGLDLIWWLNSGSTFTGGSQGGWRTLVNSNRNSDNLTIGSTNDDEWFLTGVQLEVGERATPFEHRSYGNQLDLCQRYYDNVSLQRKVLTYESNGNRYMTNVYWHRTMRATPSVGFTGNPVDTQPGGVDVNVSVQNIDNNICRVITPASTINSAWTSIILNGGTISARADAEL